MKKGKVFGKKQLIIAVMVVALGGAIWLNMEYSSQNGGFTNNITSSTDKNLGDTKYVGTDNAIETNAPAEDDYFETAKKDRETARTDAVKLIEESLKNAKITDEEKSAAMAKLTAAAKAVEQEANIETTLKAKGFKDVLCIISDKNATVIVRSDDGLISSETLQIQDAVTSGSDVTLENIKIVTEK